MLPIEVTPKPPAIEPPMIFTKPGGTTEVKPNIAEIPPKTTFDVDVYEPKLGDSYEAICQEFYNDKRFAAALRAFNQNQALTGVRYVNVPPIHILRKRFPNETGSVVPVGGSGNPSSSAPVWGPAAPSDPTPPRATGNGRGTFIVPQGGMTMDAIAKQFRLTWRDIFDLNPQYHPSAVLPAGTELKMP